MRDKLIELLNLNLVEYCHLQLISGAAKISAVTLDVEALADHLIAHGVTLPQWIPVSERLPDRQMLAMVAINHVAGGSIWAKTVGFCEYNAQTMTFNADIGEIVTHRMPLPETPKEVE